MRIDSGPVSARLFDGSSPRAIEVQAQLTANGLRLIGAEFERLLSYRLLTNLGVFGEELRIGYRREPDLRLIVPKGFAVLLADWSEAFESGREGRKLWLLSGALAAAGAAVVWAVFFGVPLAAEPLARLTPPAMEDQLGENAAAQLALVFRPCDTPQTPAAEALLARLAAPLAEEMEIGRPLQFSLVRTRIPNAITLPGGRIQVTTGLLEILDQPDELAAVLAHELGHVKHRDNLVGMYRRLGPVVLLDAVVGGGGLVSQAILVGGSVVEAGHTRRQEAAADEAALASLQAAGIDPHALARAFQALQAASDAQTGQPDAPARKQQGVGARVLSWLDSHPATNARIERARALPSRLSPALLTPTEWSSLRSACARPARAK